MKACPYCAEEIQDAAVVCKHCGRELQGDGISFAGKVLIGLVGGAVLLAMGFVAIGSNSQRPKADDDRENLLASVNLGQLSADVINGGPAAWTAVSVRLSDRFFCPKRERVDVGQAFTVRLADCVSLDGDRFNPISMSPTNVVVEAALPNGKKGVAGFTPRR